MVPRLKLDQDDPSEFEVLPEGDYIVEVFDVIPGQTKAGDEMWTLWLQIIRGPNKGKMLFDRMIFGAPGSKTSQRAAMICRRLGLTGAEIDLAPDDLMKRRAKVEVFIRQYEGKDVNAITFGGWTRLEGEDIQPAVVADDDMPF